MSLAFIAVAHAASTAAAPLSAPSTVAEKASAALVAAGRKNKRIFDTSTEIIGGYVAESRCWQSGHDKSFECPDPNRRGAKPAITPTTHAAIKPSRHQT